MKIHVLAVGQRLPDWAEAACADYLKRFPATQRVVVQTVKAEPRTDTRGAEACIAAEAERLRAALPKSAHVVALDERGQRCTTEQLAQRWQRWQHLGADVALLIGGPDGLHPALREQAHERLRLSDLTLPHALARVLLLEQLYRAWSIVHGHPYHRA